MWGIWFLLVVGATAVVLALLIGLVLFASPILAVLIFLIVGGALLAVAAFRRSAEYVERTEGQRATPPRSAGKPASGEGDVG